MTTCAVTNSFTPATTIVASQVNQNFTDLLTFLNTTGVNVYQAASIANAAISASAAIAQTKLGVVDACQVHKGGGTQTITTGAGQNVTFDTEDFDTAAMHSTVSNTDRITIVTTGLYLLVAQGSFAANGTGNRLLTINKNAGATQLVAVNNGTPLAGNSAALCAVTLASLTAADYVVVNAAQTSGGDLALSSPMFAAVRIGALV
jgi:hypothetical protein